MDNYGLDANMEPTQGVKEGNVDEWKKKGARFSALGAGCFVYALFYTLCLYHNASGITYPFFAGGTLFFFGFFIKKLETSSAGSNAKRTAYINRNFLEACIVIAGALNCATDSGVLLFFNKLLMYVLLAVLLLECWHDITGWSIWAHVKTGVTVVCGGIGKVFTPFGDMAAAGRLRRMEGEDQDKKAKRQHMIRSVAIGLAVSVPIVLFVTLLLGSADAVFGQLAENMFTFSLSEDMAELIRHLAGILFRIVAVFAVSYGILVYNSDAQNVMKVDGMAARQNAKWDPYIAVTVNFAVCAVYVVFSVIQVFALFLGWMTLPEGWTYAEYARNGFFQLVFVCLFNILLVLFTLAHFERTAVLKAVLAAICGCTYIMTASSAYRMLLYIGSYQLTFLRLFVLWALLMIAIVMAGVLAYIYNVKFGLFRFCLTALTVGWLAFSALHPDYWIASYNIQAAQEDGEADVDVDYLNNLSLDAAPALDADLIHNLSLDAAPAADAYAAMHDARYNLNLLYEYIFYEYYDSAQEYREEAKGVQALRKFNFSRAYAAHIIDGWDVTD